MLEGKLLEAFRVHADRSRAVHRSRRRAAAAGPSRAARSAAARLSRSRRLDQPDDADCRDRFRPAAVTTHTIFCLREPRDQALHWFLCGVFNSFVANYLIRLRGGTHVPAAVIHQLPVPVLARDSERLRARSSDSRAAPLPIRTTQGIQRRAAGVRHARVRTGRARSHPCARHVSDRAGRRTAHDAGRVSRRTG